jgi:hypothetical protein
MNSPKHILGRQFNEKEKSLHFGLCDGQYVLFWYDPAKNETEICLKFHKSVSIQKAAKLYLERVKK